MSPRLVLFLTWLLAVLLASAIGFFAIGLVGAVLRDRGPLGVVPHEIGGQHSAEAGSVLVSERFRYDEGELTVECRGMSAVLVAAVPAPGWTLVNPEFGPDEDVDATFVRGGVRLAVEVYCNEGRPRPVLDG